LAIGTTVSAAPAPKREPLERVAHAGAVDRARADAGDHSPEVQHEQAVGVGVDGPGQGDHHATERHHDLRAVAVDEPGLDRHQPGLGGDEQGESELDRRPAPVITLVDRIDEQCPTVLEVGDHGHADHAECELPPLRRRRILAFHP